MMGSGMSFNFNSLSCKKRGTVSYNRS